MFWLDLNCLKLIELKTSAIDQNVRKWNLEKVDIENSLISNDSKSDVESLSSTFKKLLFS